MDASAPDGFWRDALLRRAARGLVELPLATHERSRSRQQDHTE